MGQLTDRWMTKLTTDWFVKDTLSKRLIKQLTDWLTNLETNQMLDWSIGCLKNWLSDWTTT